MEIGGKLQNENPTESKYKSRNESEGLVLIEGERDAKILYIVHAKIAEVVRGKRIQKIGTLDSTSLDE